MTRKLIGIVSLKDIILAKENTLVKDIMDTNFIKVFTMDEQEEVAKKFDKYDEIAMPVVDNEDRLVGIVTVDDAMDVVMVKRDLHHDYRQMKNSPRWRLLGFVARFQGRVLISLYLFRKV